MDNKPYNQTRQSGNPSKLLMGSALIIALSLPYVLVKNFSHHDHNHLTQSISLPKQKTTLITERPKAEATEELSKKNNAISIEHTVKAAKIVATHKQIATTNQPEKSAKKEIVAKAVSTAKVVKDNVWQIVKPKSGDSMATIFHRLGLSAQNLHLVVYKNPHARILTAIRPSQELQFLLNKKKLEKLVIPINDIQTLTVYRDGAVYKTKIDSKKVTIKDRYVTGTVNGSLYTSAQHLGIPSKLIRQMTTVLSKQVDFAHGIRSGDRFSIAYEAQYVANKLVGTGDVIAVSYTSKGKTAQAVRHISRSGTHDYYTPEGESFKKAFSRYPIKFSHISSTFTASRYHPILHYRRAHKGVDLAAPIGTPILATGDGVIKTIGRHNGYGNMIEIRHDKTYSTVYGHMLKFQKGLSKGSHIRRGQIIGYVGQTGLATGPHCHFELHVNDKPRNPTTTYIPTASPVPAREMASFRARTRALFAHLKTLEKSDLAQNSKKNNKKVG
ncbi:MAG: peptidoglycan DD-metalloendopeptidase family protein [Legionella sp.]|uniref:M23 family metallopeptidase n=1 Tax=Legionella sp. TaxID=459 RepID=UPI0039E6C330